MISSVQISSLGSEDSTTKIQEAIDAVFDNGGGIVNIQSGTYFLKYLDLRSNLTLHLEAGAHLVFSDTFSDFPAVDTRYEGATLKMHHPDIYGSHVSNVAITGEGTIDGSGAKWWKMYKQAKQLELKGLDYTPFEYTRPFLIAFDYSEHIRVEGVTLINSPAWTIHPLESKDIVISGIHIDNPLDSPNTDGIDPESCSDVKIIGNTISDGDDCIAIKSGIEITDEKSKCENIIIANNIMKHGHGGVVFGSEMSGGIENVVISNNIFDQTDRGIRMKTRRGRGGYIKNVTISNIIMRNVMAPLTINEFYGMSGAVNDNYLSKQQQPIDAGTPVIDNIKLSGIIVTDAHSVAAFIYGLPESPVTNVSLSNFTVTMDGSSKASEPEMIEGSIAYADAGMWIENTKNLELDNLEIINSKTGKFIHKQNNLGLTGDKQH